MIARELLIGFARTLAREGRGPLEGDDAEQERRLVGAVIDEFLTQQGIDPDAEFDPALKGLADRHRAALLALGQEWKGRHRVICAPVHVSGRCERKMRGEACLHPWPLDEDPPS